ncbi:MAG: hypothetical protein NC203_12585 [Firmicutes bacterium]|nr:hypothetical protein [[Eubacterium] siraeum]MCM1489192.1 hypothetical protein [Bacillota bacterium]
MDLTEAAITAAPYYDYTAEYPVGTDVSRYESKFYKWEYDMDMVAKSEEEFQGGKEVINAAKTAVEEYFKLLWRDSEYNELPGCNSIYFEKGYWGYGYHIHEEDYDLAFDLNFYEGLYDDFDGDKNKESVIIFSNSNPHYMPIAFAAFVDSDGNPYVLTESIGISESSIYPVRYNSFTHIIINSGYNNSTHHAEFYAVENGKAVHKHSEWNVGKPYKDVFMNVFATQRSGSWLIFWNNELKQYCTLAGDELSDKETEELFRFYSETFDANASDYVKECKYTEPKQIKANARKIDNIYCLDLGGFVWCYECNNGKFDFSDTRFIPGEDLYTEVFVNGIDFDRVKDNTVMLDN